MSTSPEPRRALAYIRQVGVEASLTLWQTTHSTATVLQSYPIPLQTQIPMECLKLALELQIYREAH